MTSSAERAYCKYEAMPSHRLGKWRLPQSSHSIVEMRTSRRARTAYSVAFTAQQGIETIAVAGTDEWTPKHSAVTRQVHSAVEIENTD